MAFFATGGVYTFAAAYRLWRQDRHRAVHNRSGGPHYREFIPARAANRFNDDARPAAYRGTPAPTVAAPGKRSELIVWLPLASAGETAAGAETTTRASGIVGRRILVLDDNPKLANAMLLRHLVRTCASPLMVRLMGPTV
jgi:hypothetical protein